MSDKVELNKTISALIAIQLLGIYSEDILSTI